MPELPTPEQLGLPWHEGIINIEDARDNGVAFAGWGESESRSFVVHAANNFHPMLAALEAAMLYDKAIRRRADDGEYVIDSSAAIAKGADLDKLYLDWITKVEIALKGATDFS